MKRLLPLFTGNWFLEYQLVEYHGEDLARPDEFSGRVYAHLVLSDRFLVSACQAALSAFLTGRMKFRTLGLEALSFMHPKASIGKIIDDLVPNQQHVIPSKFLDFTIKRLESPPAEAMEASVESILEPNIDSIVNLWELDVDCEIEGELLTRIALKVVAKRS